MTYNLYINDTIGWPISAAYVRSELAKCKDKPCDVYISSLGGDVATALQIRQLFIENGDVTAHLHGFVASAATIIATGCKTVKMGEFALFMIHKCSAWQEQWGQMNADDIAAAIAKLTSAKNALESIDQVIGSIYAQRTNKSVADIAEMMKAETWLNAEEAKEAGFVDEILTEEEPVSLSAEDKQRIVACGYPLPQVKEMDTAKDTETFWQRLRREFKALLTNSNRIGEEIEKYANNSNSINHLKTSTEMLMNKDYPAVMTLLLVDALATNEDGKFTLNAKQMQAINDRFSELGADKHLADEKITELTSQVSSLSTEKETLATQVNDLTSEKETLETKIKDLSSQVEALQHADGDDTLHVEGNTDNETSKSYAARARADFEKIKNLIA